MQLTTEEKYFFYEQSVQGPEFDIKFINREYKKFFKKAPLSIREDFGGTGLMCHDWVKQGSKHQATCIDLDPDPIQYGKEYHYSRLTPAEQERMSFYLKDVTKVTRPLHDVIVAFNFSYYIFKERQQLLRYFKTAKKSLHKEGMLCMDVLGGEDCFTPNTTTTEHDDHDYIWELNQFNVINHHLDYSIHFFDKKKKKLHKDVFQYDWRLWSISELTDLLKEAGFEKVHVYMEGEDGEGGGNGKFKISKNSEFCESFVGYIIALNN